MAHFQAIKVTGNVWWVGAIDWHLREFHGYRTSRGTTYNAFLVIDEKITLIDTVKAPFFEEMRERIASVIDPEKIDYIVSNHADMLTPTIRSIIDADNKVDLAATTVRFTLKPHKTFLFDAETEERIRF